MAKWLKKAVGEISKLRTYFFGAWSIFGGSVATYTLDSSRVDAKMARALYDNTHEDYKLGAGFAKKIINNTVGFMGVPSFKHKDEKAQKILKNFFDANVSKMQRVHRNAFRDGDSFVWITREEKNSKLYPEQKVQLKFNIIPPEMVKKINRDPLTGEPKEYILESHYEWQDENGQNRKAKITQRISAEKRVIEVEENGVPPGLEVGETDNPWGFIPIVHFKNEADEIAEFGKSDLEPVEPFLKAYHDVMLHAMQGSKMHSTPRLKLKLKDVAAFLRNNFGIDKPEEFAKKGGKINLEGHELMFLMESEDAEFIEARSATGDATTLLKLIFYCIVSASETPEFVFGVHTPSSLSSVKEQMPVLIQKIERKREAFTEAWKQVARIVLVITSQSENIIFDTYETKVEWKKIDPRSGQEIADELKTVVEALTLAVRENIMGMESAVEYLKNLVGTMRDFEGVEGEEGEKDRILQTMILKARLEDAAFLGAERKELEEGS